MEMDPAHLNGTSIGPPMSRTRILTCTLPVSIIGTVIRADWRAAAIRTISPRREPGPWRLDTVRRNILSLYIGHGRGAARFYPIEDPVLQPKMYL